MIAPMRVAWTFSAVAGTCRLGLRYRTQGGAKDHDANLDESGFSGRLAAFSSASTDHVGDLVILQNGTNTRWIGGGWNYYEIDYLTLAPEAPPPPSAPSFLIAPTLNLGPGPLVRRVLAASASQVTYSATGLPPGIKLDPATGFFSGAPVFSGVSHLVFTATNARGSAIADVDWLVSGLPAQPLALGRAGSAVSLAWRIDSAVPVDVERSETLAPGSWTVISADNTARSHTDLSPPATVFYRLVVR